MRDHRDAKLMARALETAFAAKGRPLSHSEALELVAAQFGFDNWNVLAAKLAAAEPSAKSPLAFTETCPILRIFDEEKAREFYLGFLGFGLDWEHRFGDNFPLYAQVSRAGLTLHLSGHHGDATPGGTVFVRMTGIRAYHAELSAARYRYMKPGVEDMPWGLVMEVTDPFGNRIRFNEAGQAA